MKKKVSDEAAERHPDPTREDSRKVLDFPLADPDYGYSPASSTKQPSYWSAALDGSHPRWSSAISTARLIGGHAVVTVTISADGSEREGIGYSGLSGGSGFLLAEQMAFCEAAAKFVSKESTVSRESRAMGLIDGSPTVATCLSDMVTPSQLRALRSLAISRGLDSDVECERRFGCQSAELSRNAASIFLAELRSPERENWDGLKMAG